MVAMKKASMCLQTMFVTVAGMNVRKKNMSIDGNLGMIQNIIMNI